jgi:hypothetical protein
MLILDVRSVAMERSLVFDEGAPVCLNAGSVWPEIGGQVQAAGGGATHLDRFVSENAERSTSWSVAPERSASSDGDDQKQASLAFVGRLQGLPRQRGGRHRRDRRAGLRSCLRSPSMRGHSASCSGSSRRGGPDWKIVFGAGGRWEASERAGRIALEREDLPKATFPVDDKCLTKSELVIIVFLITESIRLAGAGRGEAPGRLKMCPTTTRRVS